MTKILCLILVFLLLVATKIEAQIPGKMSGTIYGGTGISDRPASPFPSIIGADRRKTLSGKPCISVSPTTHSQIINSKIIDQIVIASNDCGQPIKIQVCYVGSSDCIIILLNGYQKLQRTLGISAGSTVFRYEYRELF